MCRDDNFYRADAKGNMNPKMADKRDLRTEALRTGKPDIRKILKESFRGVENC